MSRLEDRPGGPAAPVEDRSREGPTADRLRPVGHPRAGEMALRERQRGILLGFLTDRARRRECRVDPRLRSTAPARLSWMAGAVPRERAARLIDISRGGAALRVADPPPAGTAVRFRVEGGAGPTAWVDAEVLGDEPGSGPGRVRLGFRAACPSAVLKAAVLPGDGRDDLLRPAVPDATPFGSARPRPPMPLPSEDAEVPGIVDHAARALA